MPSFIEQIHVPVFLPELILGFISLNHTSSLSRLSSLTLTAETANVTSFCCLLSRPSLLFCLMQQQESPGFSILRLHCLLQLLGLWVLWPCLSSI